MKRILLPSLLLALLLVACTDHPSTGGGATSPTPSNMAWRLNVYETLIRHLVNPQGTQPIHVISDLCFNLMPSKQRCPDHLSHEEQTDLGMRLHDLGHVEFQAEDQPSPWADALTFQAIVLGPIVPMPGGLRVEGTASCGSMCGSGSVYILVAGDHGYVITGTDDRFGTSVA